MDLWEHRLQIHRIDDEIVGLIHRRTCLAKDILEAKLAMGAGIDDAERERQVLARVTEMAKELDLDAVAVGEVFQILIKMSKDRQRFLMNQNSDETEPSVEKGAVGCRR
ncbi:MAG: chorismate mutase [Methanosarcinales archaeon]|nr:chorismate mutase [Methanosarcinales archaeon]